MLNRQLQQNPAGWPAFTASTQDMLALAEEGLPQPEFLVLRSRGQAGEEGLIIGHQIVDGAARQFRREGLQKGEVGEALPGGLHALGALPAQGIAHAPAKQVKTQPARWQRSPGRGQTAEPGLGLAQRPRQHWGEGDGRLVAASQASAQIVAQTLLIERQAGGTVRGGAVAQQGLDGVDGMLYPVAIARRVRGDSGQEQGQGFRVQWRFGPGEEGEQQGQIAPQVRKPGAVHRHCDGGVHARWGRSWISHAGSSGAGSKE